MYPLYYFMEELPGKALWVIKFFKQLIPEPENSVQLPLCWLAESEMESGQVSVSTCLSSALQSSAVTRRPEHLHPDGSCYLRMRLRVFQEPAVFGIRHLKTFIERLLHQVKTGFFYSFSSFLFL